VPGMTTVRKGADESSSSTTLGSTTGLGLAVAANTTYTFEYDVLFQSAALTTGIGLAMTCPAGATINYTVETPAAANGTAAMYSGWGTAADDVVLATGVEAINTTYVAHIYGVLKTGVTAGTLAPRYRTEVNASAVTIKTDSWGALLG
jgi:hypothetical protein